MIPKVIHYCWVSDDPLPVKIQRCVDSWETHLPGYEIRRWTMDAIERELAEDGAEAGALYGRWLQEAFVARKYAFVADWVRFYALGKYGGVYLDSDVEVFKSFDDLLDLPYFLGFENGSCLEAAVIGAQRGCRWIGACLAYYKGRSFVLSDSAEMRRYRDQGEYISELGYSVRPSPCIVAEVLSQGFRVTAIARKDGFIRDDAVVCVFPRHFFSFSSAATEAEKIERYCVHLGVGSWKPKSVQTNLKIGMALNAVFGAVVGGKLIVVLRRLRNCGRKRNCG